MTIHHGELTITKTIPSIVEIAGERFDEMFQGTVGKGHQVIGFWIATQGGYKACITCFDAKRVTKGCTIIRQKHGGLFLL